MAVYDNPEREEVSGLAYAKPKGEPQMARWVTQRWLLDSTIRTQGVEFDQPRLLQFAAAAGPEVAPDNARIRAQVQKYTDIAPAFEAAARLREAKAEAEARDGHPLTAGENYFFAANYWCLAQWALDDNTPQNIFYNRRKRHCFTQYGKLADHRIEAAWVPFEGKALPGWFHLPPGYQSGKIPCVISIPGMDGYKERFVSLYGDRWLNRGCAVLSIEGPGQYEASIHGIHVSTEGWAKAGPAVYEWLAKRPEIDPERIAIVGQSFGSFFSTIAFANEPRMAACAIWGTCLEPGQHSIFQEAAVTLKKRFMYMSGYTDEATFDKFRQSLTWEGHADKIRKPYLCLSGEFDLLSPLEHTERMFRAIPGPRNLLVYQGADHGVLGTPASLLGPSVSIFMADWIADRFAGKPFPSERWYVTNQGRIEKTPY